MKHVLNFLVVVAISVFAGEDIVEKNTDVRAALIKAENENKKVLLLVERDGCGYCEKLKRDIERDIEISKLVKASYQYVIIGAENAKGTQVDVGFYPTTYVINPITHDIEREIPGYHAPKEFIEYLK